jgi:hypothetical protein
MASNERDKQWQGSQRQDSAQSGQQPGAGEGAPGEANEAATDIGASQGQDRGSREKKGGERPSAGTADIERGTASEGNDAARGSQDSLVNESTGAYKERP